MGVFGGLLKSFRNGAKPRATFSDQSFADQRGVKVDPELTVGVAGLQIYGGFLQSPEKDPSLQGSQKYLTYGEIRRNVGVVATGVRYFLDLVSKPPWQVEPADDSPAALEIADFIEDVLWDLASPWNVVVRRGAMYKFHGFSLHEWTAKTRDDGMIGLLDVEARLQSTIERWDTDVFGVVHGVIQRVPQSGEEVYIPRAKMMHLVENHSTDSPEGEGLFRDLVEPARRLQRYEMLEGFGFETDLRGMPIARAPLAELQRMVKAGELTVAEAQAKIDVMTRFIQSHIRTPELGMLLDSSTYRTQDASSSPSSVKEWELELVQGGSITAEAIGRAIDRVEVRCARILGIQHLLLGTATGTQALSIDMSTNSLLLLDATLEGMVRQADIDIVRPVCDLNGIPKELRPNLKAGKVQLRDVEQITRTLKDLAIAGVPMLPDDPAAGDVRDILGVARADTQISALDADLRGGRGIMRRSARQVPTPPKAPVDRTVPEKEIQAKGAPA